MRSSGQNGMNMDICQIKYFLNTKFYLESVSVKDRIGMGRTKKTVPTANRLVVNRSANNSNLAMNRVSTSGGPSAAVAKAKRIAMLREVKTVNSNKRTTISLRKNIFDRLGPISL